MNLLKRIALVWMQYRAFQKTVAELSRMSDCELKDVGLYWGDIARVALGQAEQRAKDFAVRHTLTHEETGRVLSTV